MTSRTDSARMRRGARWVRISALTAALIALIGTGLQPAAAASKPGKVGLVSFTAKGYDRSSKTASLTIYWPRASRAKKYEIYLSRHYSMSKPRKYTTSNRTKTMKGLTRGADYFVRVRGVNGSKRGSYSTRVGHTTIRLLDLARGDTYRVMSYNVCSRVCSKWESRQPGAQERVRAYRPDVLAAQEADNLAIPAGYSQAHYKSGKRLLFRSGRFTLDPGTEAPEVLPSVDTRNRCTPTRTWETYGEVSLGYHGGGCRYAVWAKLTDTVSGARTMFVDVHTVSGDNSTDAMYRKYEIRELLAQIQTQNPEGLPVIYAGDFNSHKNRSNDYPAREFQKFGYYDAYDLAMSLRQQHNNSYNDYRTTPKISYKWGDHVDKVWIRPDLGRVVKWNNGALIKNGKMVTPIPSDHSPIIADVRIN
ncbi:endonuclease/exonuclease/phosphatase family protein [Aeromicrobium sp. P5_D10]